VLQDAVDNKIALLNLMRAESDFYNVVSAAEFKGFFLDTFTGLTIIYAQYRYAKLCEEETPSLVRCQIEQLLLRDGSQEFIEEIKTRYYTCFDELGFRALHLTNALSYVFLRRPRNRKSH
jgi:hypothetical protein